MELKITGLQQVNDLLAEVQKKSKDFSPLEATLRDIFYADASKRFESSPSVDTGGMVYGDEYWRRLKRVPPHRRGGQVLIDSETMMQSVTVEGDGNGIFEINGTEVIFGSRVPYANKQNVDRPFLFWHPLLLEQVTKAISEWLADITL